jgi:hypothetical protein
VHKGQLIIIVPMLGLLILVLVLYSPQIISLGNPSATIPGLSDMSIGEKTNIILTFSIAVFAAIEGYSMWKRGELEAYRHKIADARYELEKAYGPMYTLLNKAVPSGKENSDFWLDFEERKKIDEIMATYPFMFPNEINTLWQEKIRNPQTLVQASLERGGVGIDLGVYLELKKMVNEEYTRRVKSYHRLIEK